MTNAARNGDLLYFMLRLATRRDRKEVRMLTTPPLPPPAPPLVLSHGGRFLTKEGGQPAGAIGHRAVRGQVGGVRPNPNPTTQSSPLPPLLRLLLVVRFNLNDEGGIE